MLITLLKAQVCICLHSEAEYAEKVNAVALGSAL